MRFGYGYIQAGKKMVIIMLNSQVGSILSGSHMEMTFSIFRTTTTGECLIGKTD